MRRAIAPTSRKQRIAEMAALRRVLDDCLRSPLQPTGDRV